MYRLANDKLKSEINRDLWHRGGIQPETQAKMDVVNRILNAFAFDGHDVNESHSAWNINETENE